MLTNYYQKIVDKYKKTVGPIWEWLISGPRVFTQGESIFWKEGTLVNEFGEEVAAAPDPEMLAEVMEQPVYKLSPKKKVNKKPSASSKKTSKQKANKKKPTTKKKSNKKAK